MFGRLALACLMLLVGCRSFDPKHPAVGKPTVEADKTGYWIWFAASRDPWRASAAAWSICSSRSPS